MFCRNKRLNQASFVLLLYFVLFAFSGLCLVFVVSDFNLSSVLYIGIQQRISTWMALYNLTVLMCC